MLYERVAKTWHECLPLGSGRLGAMLDGGLQNGTVYLNDVTAWSGYPTSEDLGAPSGADARRLFDEARAAMVAGESRSAERALKAMQARYSQAYVPLATLALTVTGGGGEADYRRSLDLTRGIHTVTAGAICQRSFITRDGDVLVIVTTGADTQAKLESPLNVLSRVVVSDGEFITLRLPSDVAPGHEPDLPGAEWATPALEAAVALRWVRSANGTVLFVASDTTYVAPGQVPAGNADDVATRVMQRLDTAIGAGADVLEQEHVARHRSVMNRVKLSLGDSPHMPTDARLARAALSPVGAIAHDPSLVALLFDFGRYLLWSSSRAGGLPPTLQGLWNAELRPPWSSNYTINANTQINHWASYVTNIPESADALIEFIGELGKAATPRTLERYGLPGWAAHHNTDAWLFSSPVGRGHGDVRWAFWPWGAAWLARHLIEPLDFGLAGDSHRTRIWPTLRGAAEFALAWHREERPGIWITSPSTSPENAWIADDGTPEALDEASAMDLALIRDLLEHTVAIAASLNFDSDPVAQAAAERLRVIPEMPQIADDGTLLEWSRPRREEDPHHRHVSHLYGLYPGAGRWDAAHRAAAAATLERRGDDSSGWSLIWKAALWARLGRADKVSDLIRLLLRPVADGRGQWAAGLYPNLFAAHPPFQIDGNLGFPAALAEALLQSHDGIELLPALPADLPDGSIRGLVARPGVRVDLVWADGRLVTAALTPLADGTLVVGYNGRHLVVDGHAGERRELFVRDFDGLDTA